MACRDPLIARNMKKRKSKPCLNRSFWRDLPKVFLLGFLIGCVLAVIFVALSRLTGGDNSGLNRSNLDFNNLIPDKTYENWLRKLGLRSAALDPDEHRYNSTEFSGTESAIDENTEAGFLAQKVKVSCVIFPARENAAKAVKETWGRHCTDIKFYSQKLENGSIPIEKIPSKSSFELLCKAYRNVPEDTNWVFTASEDTFVILENFRKYVAPMNSSASHYLGHAMRFWGVTYNWNEAGFALSAGALNALKRRFPDDKSCAAGGRFWKNGDWYLGKHLKDLGIGTTDTRDYKGRGRFNGHSFKRLLFPGGVSLFDRYWRDSLYLSPDGPECCSDEAVTFHGILSDSKMYQLEYIFQHLRPFPNGGKYGNVAKAKEDLADSKKKFLTWEEKLKDDALSKMFQIMMTTEVIPVGPEQGTL